ncbi:MAG: DUF3108 domain-containing protein [Saprospiraceae bacterium]|nr:DUF3108 domain-containing protein [Saprospiraceae bacterium]
MKMPLLLAFTTLLGANRDGHPRNGDLAYGAGERLSYRVYYNWNFVWLTAGEVHFDLRDEGETYHISVEGKTFASYDWFYKVRDEYHSYIDKETGLPSLYIRKVQQGSYRRYEKVVFDYPRKLAYSYTGKTEELAKLTIVQLDKHYFDLVSVMYHLRNLPIKEQGKKVKTPFNVLLDDEKYELGIRYKGDKKRHEVKESGTYNTFEAVADVISGHVFDDDARLKLWVSDDRNRVPVLIESPLVVGSVKAILSNYANLRYPFEAKLE